MDAAGVTGEAPWAGSAESVYCYVTTTGRRTGRPHTIEIWFGLEGDRLFFLSGGGDRSDWVRNLLADPSVSVRIGERTFAGRARVVLDPTEEDLARRLLAAKYQGWHDGEPMSRWARTALPIAVDLAADAASAR